MRSKGILLVMSVLLTSMCYPNNENKDKKDSKTELERKIYVEKFKDRNTDCEITYDYYKKADGTKVIHGKYKRQWSLPKGHRSTWAGREMITATFVDGRINGTVTINCDKQRWRTKNEFVKGKGRKVTLVPVESYVARNLKLEVRNDTLSGSFNFELGNLKYEAQGSVNEAGEMKGKYTLYEKNDSHKTDSPRNIKDDWVIVEQYLCDPEYTYKDAVPQLQEVKLGYNGTSRGEQIRIRIPRLRLSINPL